MIEAVHVRFEYAGRGDRMTFLVALEFRDRSVVAWRLAELMRGRLVPSLDTANAE